VDDRLTLKELKKYAGVTTDERARQLWKSALICIWEASPAKVQQQFPKEEVIRGKSPVPMKGRQLPEETRRKISTSLKGSETAREAIEKARKMAIAVRRGSRHSTETRAKMSEAHRKRREQILTQKIQE